MTFAEDRIEGVEVWWQVGCARVRIARPRKIKGVAAPAHFDEDGVEIAAAAVLDEFSDFVGVEKAGAKGVHPDAAQLARNILHRLRGRGDGSLSLQQYQQNENSEYTSQAHGTTSRHLYLEMKLADWSLP